MNSDVMVGFGGKQAWLAVRDGEPAEVLAALGLHDLGDVSWRDGIDLAHLTDDRVAVTPPLAGARGAIWVLAAGRYLMRPGTLLDLTDLSRRLHTEVQFFATHRATEAHRWQRADDGALVRAFGYVGQTGSVTTWYGDPDPAERAAGLPPTFRAEGAPLDEAMLNSLDDELTRLLRGEAVGGSAEGSTVLVSEQDVLRVADGWSIDPTTLDGRVAPGPLRVGAAA
ncbi:hypothetical protein [Couchioplanes caeruleus]|uniref:Uncharacterized protein n=2 Tax=Couchioplanes caeruleus TaxID=56438 RepID=A0A1K0GUR0_9ACTN|nr:hypothetical protein [Couchioplanes caeruleus]OJF13115.1 hypothetical protein BG844_16890 [Couchioplanes caeruleus subsp. caeruleus]ROP33371.1 hypothetical protein EDD30_6346 [Couchioplanes caeruleus]